MYLYVIRYTVLCLIWAAMAADRPYKWNVVDVLACAGEDVLLSCGEEELFLDGPGAFITWFKEMEKETPHGVTSTSRILYQYPNAETTKSSRRFPIFCNHEDFCQNETSLKLKSVSCHDSGLYRCRVQYETIPAEDYFVRLDVSVKIGRHMIAYDEDHIKYVPHKMPARSLGSSVTVFCEAARLDGTVTVWWEYDNRRVCAVDPKTNCFVFDCDNTQRRLSVMEAVLHIPVLGRYHLEKNLTCVAGFSYNLKKLDLKLNIDVAIHENISHVRILNDTRLLYGQNHSVVCAVHTVHTIPHVLWEIDGKVVTNFEKDRHEVVKRETRKEMCVDRENNMTYENSFKSREYNQTVFYSHVVLDTSNPMIYNAKNITCRAFHLTLTDDTMSDTTRLLVGYPPVCANKPPRRKVYIMEGKPFTLRCNFTAKPDIYQVFWIISGTLDHYYSTNITTYGVESSSGLYKRIANNTMIGETLTCTASNEFGDGNKPCYFEFEQGSVPEAPSCNIDKNDTDSRKIICTPGWDGGINATLKGQIYGVRNKLITNRTFSFVNNSIWYTPRSPKLSYVLIWASSEWGNSRKVRVNIPRIGPTEPPPKTDNTLIIIILCVSGAAVLLAIVGVLSYIIFCRAKRRTDVFGDIALPVLKTNDGSFHREPAVEEESSLSPGLRVPTATTNITVNQLANCASDDEEVEDYVSKRLLTEQINDD